MATSTKKSSSSSSSKSSSSSSSNNTQHHSSSKRSFWGLNKISFYCIAAVAFLYVISAILAVCGVSFKVVSALQGLATAVIICIVAYLAYKYVKNKPTVWMVLYILCLLLVILGIILPLVV